MIHRRGCKQKRRRMKRREGSLSVWLVGGWMDGKEGGRETFSKKIVRRAYYL